MNRINFKEVNSLIDMVSSFDEALTAMQNDTSALGEEIRSAAQEMLDPEIMEALAQIPVEELHNSKATIRVNVLEDAGYRNLRDLAQVSNAELMAVNGIGEKQTTAIRAIIAVFRRQIAGEKTIRLSMEDDSPQNLRLIRAVAAYRKGQEIRADASSVCGEFHDRTQDILPRIAIRSPLRWLFSGRKTKEMTTRAISDLTRFASSPIYERAGTLYGRYREIAGMSDEEAKRDFEQHSAEYYVLLERLFGKAGSAWSATGYLPADLAARIDAFPVDLSCFTGNLRAYQGFGVKYILHQKRVLLGDDMGLGKTVQAIAVMAHLFSQRGGGHFLIVCPAGVLINWCREIRRFSSIPAYLIHGDGLEMEFSQWKESGGAAVTNYETMGKIIERINGHTRRNLFGKIVDDGPGDGMPLCMMIIDEAHYIKNPQALRTQYIHMLEDEAEHILLMTGTPLENHVNEMCALTGFLRPDLAEQVRDAASKSHTEEFRELLAPVYLRRRRTEVLQELPPVEEKEEWCSMSAEDRSAYAEQVLKGNFMGARRVGFLQDDLSTSSKAQRLAELCAEMETAGRKAIVYSYFRETIDKAGQLLKDRCAGIITGSTAASERQGIIDRFAEAPDGSVLICQVQAGGTGLNIQAASIVIFCEPQIKPSLTKQAVARAWRMGQVRNVQVHHLLCEDTVDEAVTDRLKEKQFEFDLYAEESSLAQAADELMDKEWIREFMEREHSRYLPAVAGQVQIHPGISDPE